MAQHGGARSGAGRPKGSNSGLPHGSRKALIARRTWVRLAPDATPAQRATAREAEDAVLAVLREDWKRPGAATRLSTAALLLDRLAGPVRQRVALGGDADAPPIMNLGINLAGALNSAQKSTPEAQSEPNSAELLTEQRIEHPLPPAAVPPKRRVKP